jgi:hypothetical protein
MPPQINLQELYSMQKKKLTNRRKCFDHIIELCHRRIRTVSSYCGQNTFYEIPGFVIGYPLYNLNECIEYVVDALRKNSFLIQILPPPNVGVIYISWDPREIKPQKALPPPVSINNPTNYNHYNKNTNNNNNETPDKVQFINNLLNTTTVKKVKNPLGYREQMRLF